MSEMGFANATIQLLTKMRDEAKLHERRLWATGSSQDAQAMHETNDKIRRIEQRLHRQDRNKKERSR